jgi:hypothetical protein
MKIPILTLAIVGLASNALSQPAITSHPMSQRVSLGAKVTFSVRGSGIAPLSYQWRFAGGDISGATANSFVLTNVQSLHEGDYTAVVANSSGSVTSLVAVLKVDRTFTKMTVGSIATDSGKSTACAWGDYDNDGWPDLFVNNRDGPNFLYRNKRDGTFQKITVGHLVSDTGTHLAGVWGDYDNDGFLDLLVVNGGFEVIASNYLYHNNGNGTFSQPSAAEAGSIVTDMGGFHGAAWGDFDGDGYLDVFVANFTGTNYLYRNVGGTRFEKVLNTSNRPAALGLRSAEAAWADYDRDGYLDLIVIQHASASGKTLLFRNNRQGILTPVTAGPIVGEGGFAAGLSWADYDNDGSFDLSVSTINLERDFLYRNQGNGTFNKIINRSPVNEGAHTYGVAWGDYDNDGLLDLFVANGAFGPPLDNALFRNKGDGTFEKVSAGSPANDQGHSFGCAWVDYDNDGFLDLFVTNDPTLADAPPEKNFLYRNMGNSSNWLKVRCVGTVSKRVLAPK